MTTIFIKSYQKDFRLLKYFFMSLNKYVTGDYDVVLMIDRGNDLGEIKNLLQSNVRVVEVRKTGDGYLYQQYCKLISYQYSESEYILFADSDCLFYKPTNINELVKDNKPRILYTHYSKVGDAICWKQPTQDIFNIEIEYEFMRRLPLIYHRSTLACFHSWFKVDLLSYILRQDKFSEFNAIGAYAYYFERDKYDFVDTDNWQWEDPLTIQLWSWANNHESETHKLEYKKIIDSVNKVLDLNINEI